MNRHTVFVAGKRFVLLSDDKEEYIQNLANEVSEAINRIGAENPTLDRRSSALLCALDYADDREKEKLRIKSLSDKAQPLIAQADKQSKQIRELKDLLAKKDEEIKKLTELNEKLKKDVEDAKKVQSVPQKTEVKNEQKTKNNFNDKKQKGYKPTRQYSLFENE
ncbi:MAG: cell division protein ZapA [Ruminococcus sp.]|nr:cell division protein ZapA [Ruminococcus sp.]